MSALPLVLKISFLVSVDLSSLNLLQLNVGSEASSAAAVSFGTHTSLQDG